MAFQGTVGNPVHEQPKTESAEVVLSPLPSDASEKRAMQRAVAAALRGLAAEFGHSQDDFDALSRTLLNTWEVIVSSKASGTSLAGPIWTEVRGEAGARKDGKEIVGYVDGCFDITHSGHYNVLRQARQLCDKIIVGLHTDEEITLHKGPPVMRGPERVAVVEGCKWVDRVVFGVPYAPSIELLDELGCDFVVHGDDIPMTGSGQNAYDEIIKQGRLRIVKRTEGISTTTLVGRMLMCSRDHHSKARDSHSTATDVPRLLADDDAGEAEETRKIIGDIVNPEIPTHVDRFLPTSRRLFQFSKFSDNADQRASLPPEKLLVVYIDGAFDLLHAGHVELFKATRAAFEAEAKESGKEVFLLVGVHDDVTVNSMRGQNYPIMDLHERVFNVLSCRYVDEVIIGAPWVITPDLISTMHIAYVVTGADHDKRDLQYEANLPVKVDPYKVPKKTGIHRPVKTKSELSALNTDVIVDRILENRKRFEAKFRKKAAAEDQYRAESSEAMAEM